MALSARQLNRATLARQLLLRREPLPVVEAVRRVVALQAQEPASPYLALWSRVDGFDPADLDAALRDLAVQKAPLMRITLHAVAAEDRPAFHAAVRPILRAARLNDPRFRRSGLTPDDADALIADLLAHLDRPRSKAEVEEVLVARLGAPAHPGVWWALRTCAPIVHVPTGGPWSFGPQPAYRAAPAAPGERAGDEPPAARLVRRYLEGFGPATARDVGQFTMLRRPEVRAALDGLAGALVQHAGPEGAVLLDVPGAPLPDADAPAPPRLLPMWDSTLLAYADRSRVLRDEHRPVVIRRNGDVLPTLLVDGCVAGVWRTVDDAIEATAFHPLPQDAWEALGAEAGSLLALLAARDPRPYRRFDRWYADLPAAEVRLLGR